jgi:hypothetical protein
MKITTLSRLAVAAVVFTLATEANHAQAATGCAASKAVSGLSTLVNPTEGNPTGLGQTPDAQALAKALGGFGVAAGLVAGGTLLYRKRGAEGDLADDTVPEAALVFEVQPEAVLVSEATAATVSEQNAQDQDLTLSLSR